MEVNSTSGESCRVQNRAYIISPGFTSVQFFEDKYGPRGNQKYWSSVARVRKSFRTSCFPSYITCTVHYFPHINYHWSKQFIQRSFPIWTLQQNIQWSCTDSSIWIRISCCQCWIFRNRFHNKGIRYIFSHRLYSISAYGINFPPRKLDISRSKR